MVARRAALMSMTLAALAGTALLSGVVQAANETLKIGFVGVTSGPAAAWGTSNVRSMETLAEMLNEKGGVAIGGKTYDIEIVTFDDQKDPKRAIAGMEKMAQEGVHYVVGPNVDDGAAAVRPVAEAKGIIYFPYAFPKELYTPPASNAVLGMVASYQSGPAIYKFLKEKKDVNEGGVHRRQRSPIRSRRRRAALPPPRRWAWRWWVTPPTRTTPATSRPCSRPSSRRSRTCWCFPAWHPATRRSSSARHASSAMRA